MKSNIADWRVPLRERLRVPDAVTGRGVCVGLLSAFSPTRSSRTDLAAGASRGQGETAEHMMPPHLQPRTADMVCTT